VSCRIQLSISWFFTFTMSTMHGHMNIKFSNPLVAVNKNRMTYNYPTDYPTNSYILQQSKEFLHFVNRSSWTILAQ
jgi:hypothetical protein